MKKHLLYSLLLALVTASATDNSNGVSETISKKIVSDSGHTTHVNVHVTTVGGNGEIAGKCNEGKSDENDSCNSHQTASNPPNASINIPSGDDVQRVVLTPGKNFLITVDPCNGAGEGNSGGSKDFKGIGLPDSVFDNQSDGGIPQIPVVPQNIIPAAREIELSADDARILESIEQQSDLDDLSAEQLNERVKKYIEFLNLLRGAQMNRIIKLPRLVFIGEKDEYKYAVIESLIGLKGALEAGEGDLKLEPRFPVPIRYTLLNQADVKTTTFKILGGGESQELKGNALFTALKGLEVIKAAENAAKLDETPVEIEIVGPTVPSLVFMDLPWRIPESDQKAANYPILRKLLFKYLEQPWGMSVSCGPSSETYNQWQTLRLVRAFDSKMQRVFTVALDTNPAENVRLQGLVLGLQSGQPAMKSGKMFYLQQKEGISALPAAGLCTLVSGCSRDELLQGLQRRLLRIWNAMRPEAQQIIQKHFDHLKSRVAGYDGFWGEGGKVDLPVKLKALIDQATPLLRSRLVFAPEDRDSLPCSGSSLDLIKETIFEKEAGYTNKGDNNNANTRNGSSSNNNSNSSNANTNNVGDDWNSVFEGYQKEISKLPKFPDGIDWKEVKLILGEMKRLGPNRPAINAIKRLVLNPQMDALKAVKLRLFDSIGRFYRTTLKSGLTNQINLEAFDNFRAALTEASETVLKEALETSKKISEGIEAADATVGWIYNFSNDANFWINLNGDLEEFQRVSSNGFVEICSRNAIQLPRLIIDNLLKPAAGPHEIIKAVSQSKEPLEKLTEISSKAVEALKRIEERIRKTDELLKSTNQEEDK